MCHDMGAKLWRHLRPDAEPALEAWHRLVQQHAEAIDNAVAARLGGGEKRRFERAVDDVGDDGVGWKRRKVDVERGFPVMPRLVALTSSPQPASARFRSSHGITETLAPKPSAKAFARPSVRFASRIFVAPASINPCRMARAAPPAPSTTTGRLPLFHSGASAARCVMKP